jgi:3-keto-disaccharide hydrolase
MIQLLHRSIPLTLGMIAAALPLTAVHCPTAGRRAPEARQLFNGRDLTNFYPWMAGTGREDPNHVFSVVDQVDGAPAIRVSGQGYGGFITSEEFADYRLTVEFHWGLLTWGNRKNGAKDSGVLLHCQGPDGNTGKDFKGPWMLSQECQIIQGGVGDLIMVAGYDAAGKQTVPRLTATAGKDRDGEDVYDPNAPPREFQGGRINWSGRDPDWKDMLGFRGRQDVESPGGEWTRLEVICDGDGITNIVNGKTVNQATKSSLTRGKLLFQCEGAEIYFRKIQLEPLEK